MQMVTMKDYEGFGGFGAMSAGDVDELNKALGSSAGSPRLNGSDALRVESLEAVLRSTTFANQHIKLWKIIPKIPAYSTSEEYNLQTSYGGEGGMFIRDGEIPQTQDASYERRNALIKYVGVTKEVTHVQTLVKPAHGNQIALETANGTNWLLGKIEAALFKARADVNPLAWDGYDQQIMMDSVAGAQNVFDLRGGILTADKVEEAANTIIEAFGVPTDIFGAPRVMSDLGKSYLPKERFLMPGPAGGRMGVTISEVNTTAGILPLQSDLFLSPGGVEGRRKAPSGPTSTKAPLAPTVSGASAGSGSQFAAADIGTYQYKVSAINAYGESAGAQESGGVAVAGAGEVVTLTITDGGSTGESAATGYRIYRSKVGGAAGTEEMIGEVARSGGATTLYLDSNQYLPGTSRAYMFQVNTQAMAFKQLAPMMKIALPGLALSIRWSQVLYGTPVVYDPRKHAIFINVANG